MVCPLDRRLDDEMRHKVAVKITLCGRALSLALEAAEEVRWHAQDDYWGY